MERKGLRVNSGKTKIMICGTCLEQQQAKAMLVAVNFQQLRV